MHPKRRASDHRNGHVRWIVGLAGVLITVALLAFGASKSKTLEDTEERSRENYTEIKRFTSTVDVRLKHIEGDVREIKEHVLKE